MNPQSGRSSLSSEILSNEKTSKRNSSILGIFLLFLLFWFCKLLSNQDPDVVLFKQYIALLRIPIISGLILFLFPILSIGYLSKFLRNLFVISGKGQLLSVQLISTLTAFMITSSFKFITENAPNRFGISNINLESLDLNLGSLGINLGSLGINLESLGILKEIIDKASSLTEWLLSNPEIIIQIILIVPLWSITFLLSAKESERKRILVITGLIGLIASLLLGISINLFNLLSGIYINLFNLLTGIISLLLGISINPIAEGATSEFLSLIVIGFLIYFAVLLPFNPKNLKNRFETNLGVGAHHDEPLKELINSIKTWFKSPNLRFLKVFTEASALFYVLLLIWLFTGVFSGLTFGLDKWHIPVVLVVVGWSGATYLIGYVDHFFKLVECQDHKLKEIDNFKDIIHKRLELQDQWIKDDENIKRTLVVIATSGGGIQASGWTAQVLCGLQEQLGDSFTQSIGLISSVSGGSVGTMFFLDQFDDTEHCPPFKYKPSKPYPYALDTFKNHTLNNIFEEATRDWLDAVGWGLAYSDIFKGLGFSGLLNPFGVYSLGKYSDRGYAIEWDWQRSLKRDNSDNKDNKTATLASWRKKVLAGEIPIPIFNATLVEDGRRFLISPVKLMNETLEELTEDPNLNLNKQDRKALENAEASKALDFHTLYRGYDLDVTTAARLSATFPYVSPIARNDSQEGLTHIYHVADGGFFDNTGIFTAIEWLDTHLENKENKENKLEVERVVLIQINAIPSLKLSDTEKGGLGWLTQLIGPFQTLNSIRDSTQVARNRRLRRLIKEKWTSKPSESSQSEQRRTVEFKTFNITFPDNLDYEPPLSWKLTRQQIGKLKEAWQQVKKKDENFKQLKKLWKKEWHMPESFSS